MPEYLTTIVEYLPKQVAKDGRQFTIHNFKTVEGMELTARSDVANLVNSSYMHQPLRVTVRDEQKGSWLNHYLDHVEPATGAYMPAQAAQQAQQVAQPNPIPPPTPPPPLPQQNIPPIATGTNIQWHQELSEKDKQIHRQVAAKVAAQLSTTPSEFWQNCKDLAQFFDTGDVPGDPEAGRYDGVPF